MTIRFQSVQKFYCLIISNSQKMLSSGFMRKHLKSLENCSEIISFQIFFKCSVVKEQKNKIKIKLTEKKKESFLLYSFSNPPICFPTPKLSVSPPLVFSLSSFCSFFQIKAFIFSLQSKQRANVIGGKELVLPKATRPWEQDSRLAAPPCSYRNCQVLYESTYMFA